MPTSKKYLAHFEFVKTYHIYNRSNDGELLFRTEKNKSDFLKKLESYTSPFIDIYAWNLLSNHFHLVIRVKSCAEIVQSIEKNTQIKSEIEFLKKNDIDKLLQVSFKRFFICYSMMFNRFYNRKGNLFHRQFKRVTIEDDVQFTQTLIYVHANALKHKLCNNILDHKWTSYHTILNNKHTGLLRNEVLEWFGGREAFIKIHSFALSFTPHSGISIEGDN